MGMTVVECDGYRVLKITGFLDGRTAESAEVSEFLEAPARDIGSHWVIDLSAVEYVNSSALGLFVRFLAEAQKNDFSVFLLNPPPSVRAVLDMTGLSVVLPILEREQDACNCLGQSSPHKVAEDVDYDALSEEIEDIITKGESDRGDSQLQRLTGKD